MAATPTPTPTPTPTSTPALRDIAILVYPGCMGTEIFAVTDLLLIANHLAAAMAPGHQADLPARLVSARREPVALAGGFMLGAPYAGSTGGVLPALVVVPGLEVSRFGQWEEKLALLKPELALLRKWHARGVAFASVCLGGFLLAESGVVGRRRMTAPWAFEREFRLRYPAIDVDSGAVVCTEKGLITSGPFSSVFDLALQLVEQHHGTRIARATANMALVRRGRGSQQPYVDPGLIPQTRQAFSEQVNRWLATHLVQPYDLQQLAAQFHTSARTLLRRYKAETGQTPLAWLQRTRIEKAKRLLEVSALSLAEVVAKVGYEDVATFSRLFVRHVGESPARYRRQSLQG